MFTLNQLTHHRSFDLRKACPSCFACLRLAYLRLQLVGDIALILPSGSNKLCMASPGHDFVVFVHKPDRSIRECLSNCGEDDQIGQLKLKMEGPPTFITDHFTLEQVAYFSARVQVGHAQIR